MQRRRVEEAFRQVRREDFLPAEQRAAADQDRPLPIGYGQTNSQPSTVRAMLDLLDVQPGARVLDVGCGSGWTTALLGILVGPDGQVHGVELVPELVAWGRRNLALYALPWAVISPADPDVLGLRGQAPFDRILVSAQAGSLPGELVEQLERGGAMVIPVAGTMLVVRRTDDAVDVVRHGAYAFVPLVEPG